MPHAAVASGVRARHDRTVELLLKLILGLFALAMNVTGPEAYLAEAPTRPYQRAEAGETAAREVRRVAETATLALAPPPPTPPPVPRGHAAPAVPDAPRPDRREPPPARGPPSI